MFTCFRRTPCKQFALAFFRNVFIYENAQNHTPGSSLGFGYQPTLGTNSRFPYLIVSGYASVGNPITGPQNTVPERLSGILFARHDARPP